MYIDYEQSSILGHKIQTEADELQVLIQQVKEIQDKLEPILTAKEDIEYLQAFINQTQIIAKLAETIGATGTFLVNVSNAYSNQAEENCGMMG